MTADRPAELRLPRDAEQTWTAATLFLRCSAGFLRVMLQRHARFLPLLLCYFPVLAIPALQGRSKSGRDLRVSACKAASASRAASRPPGLRATESRRAPPGPEGGRFFELSTRAQALLLPWPPEAARRRGEPRRSDSSQIFCHLCTTRPPPRLSALQVQSSRPGRK